MDGTTSDPRDHALVANLDWVRRLALALTRDRDAAEDVAQDTVRLWLERRPATGEGPRGWLAAVARRLALDRTRSEAARRSRERAVAHTEESEDFEVVERGARQRRVVEAVMALEEPYRSTVLYRYLDDLATPVVAERMGVPEATVRKRIERGLALLRRRLDREFGERSSIWALALLAPRQRHALEEQAMNTGTWSTGWTVAVTAGVALLGAAAWRAYGDAKEVERAVPVAAVAPLVESQETETRDAFEPAVATDPGPPREEVREPASHASSQASRASAPQPFLEGRLVSRVGREPIAGVPLVILGGGVPCETVTADDGTFACRSITTAGRRSVIAGGGRGFDGRAWIGDESVPNHAPILGLDWRPGDEPAVLELVIGPTLPLDMKLPRGIAVSDMEAELEAAVAFPPPPGFSAVGVAAAVELGDDGKPVVRCALGAIVGATFANETTVWRLRVTSRDGLWLAETPVPRTFGPSAKPVRVQLASAARLELAFQRDDGGAAREIEVVYSARSGARRGRARSEDGARIVLGGLPPDAYRLEVRAQGCEPMPFELALRGGESVQHDVRLATVVGGGAVRGRLASRSGRFDLPLDAVLTRVDRSEERRVAVEWIEDGGRLVAPFAFEDLRPGDRWNLRLQPRALPPRERGAPRLDHWSWSPSPGEIVPPVEGLELVYEDELPIVPLAFLVVDSQSGQPLDGAHLLMDVGGHYVPGESIGEAGRYSADVAVGPPLRWAVRAPNHVIATGDRGAVRDGAVEVRLERGWGGTVRVYESGSGRTLAGVEVVLDGVLVGTTDAGGACRIHHVREPASAAFRLPGWRWSQESRGAPSLSPNLWGEILVRMDRAR